MYTETRLYETLGEPCRNFNILNWTVLIDPLDLREKMVLSNFAGGAIGTVIFIDLETGEGESYQLPSDNGAWGLLYLENYGRLLVGTCANQGYLHSLDLKTRTWGESLKDPGERYFWNLTLGSDGRVYGGTWPGCSLLRYDPEQHTLINVGRVSDNPENQYSRPVYGEAPGYIIVAGGYNEPFLKAWHIAEERFIEFGTQGATIKEVNEQFICTEYDGTFEFFSSATLKPLHDESLPSKLADHTITLPNGQKCRSVQLRDGRRVGIRGQEYFIWDVKASQPELQRIPVPAPATQIHGLTSDEDGKIWGSTVFGQTIFKYDPVDGTYWNSSNVCNQGGEVYGLQFVDRKLYMSAYVGGDHIVYDPSSPWDQLNNINPKTLTPVRPQLIRPTGRTILGPDRGVWSGWSAKYGTYGGGLSRIDTDTQEVISWYDPIPGQQVAGLSADDRYIYFSTNGEASGLPYNKDVECHFVVWSPDGHIVYKHRFARGVTLGYVLAIGGYVLLSAGNVVYKFDPNRMEFGKPLEIGQWIRWMVGLDKGRVYLFGQEDLYLLDTVMDTWELVTRLPGPINAATIAEGTLYFSHETFLYKLKE